MNFAYADPPYLGCCRLYEHFHPDGFCWDEAATHRVLIDRLVRDFPDGWALSLSAPSLQAILAMCPPDVRVSAWCKTWHQIRPNVPVQFSWEPVILRGGRKRKNDPMVRDWLACPATRLQGTPGAKPPEFAFWIFDQLGMEPDDDLDDLYHGSGAISRAWDSWRSQQRLGLSA